MEIPARSPKWLAATLSMDGVITGYSSGSDRLTGYPSHEIIGMPVTRILADSSAFELIRILDAATQTGHWEGEIIHRTRTGRSFEARSTLSLLAGAGSQPAGYILFSIVKNPSALELQGDPAVSEVGSRLRSIAHDLNNPLAVMMGFTQLVMMNSACQGTMRADIEKLFSELKRIVQTVETLHQYAISLQEKPKIAVSS